MPYFTEYGSLILADLFSGVYRKLAVIQSRSHTRRSLHTQTHTQTHTHTHACLCPLINWPAARLDFLNLLASSLAHPSQRFSILQLEGSAGITCGQFPYVSLKGRPFNSELLNLQWSLPRRSWKILAEIVARAVRKPRDRPRG